jgi:hypothetical protein
MPGRGREARTQTFEGHTKALYGTSCAGPNRPKWPRTLGLGQVKPADVLTLTKSGKAESTVRQVHTVLRAIFESALADGMVARNVVPAAKRPTVTRRETHGLAPSRLWPRWSRPTGLRMGSSSDSWATRGLRRGGCGAAVGGRAPRLDDGQRQGDHQQSAWRGPWSQRSLRPFNLGGPSTSPTAWSRPSGSTSWHSRPSGTDWVRRGRRGARQAGHPLQPCCGTATVES